ncbi:hypothetical protein [Roseateles sp. BYS87W]|uniref:Ig-like domain (Group 1) n=1 Tax=Pelomonas baiyunensis TaxID=3299026 RepID=A0ABW7GTU0_9BURK
MFFQSNAIQGWRRIVQSVIGLGMTAALVACGGGGGSAGTSVFPGGTETPNLTGLSISGNSTLANNGTDTLAVKVTALTTGNAALVGKTVPVTLSVSSGAVITAAGNTTGSSDGALSASVSLTDRTSRPVTVTATSGSITQTFTFNVVDSVTGSKVADISLVTDRATLPNNGTQSVTITATTLDSSRGAAGGVPLTFAVDDPVKSAFVVVSGGATATDSASGQLKATVSLGANLSNRTVKVTATSGTVSRQVSFDVVDSAAVTPTAADMSIALDRATVGNGGSDQVAVTVTAVDSSRNAVKDIDVTFSVDSNAVLVVGNSKTAADGTAKATVTIGADRSNRLVTVTAKSGTFSRQASFRVTGAKLQATLQPATLKVGESGQVQYTLTDVNSNPMVGAVVKVQGPGDALSATGVTDSRGQYLYSYVAFGSGAMQIAGQAGGASITSMVQVDAKLADVPAQTNIASATFTASQSVVSVNAVGSKDNRAELRFLFLTENNVPVPNVRVRVGLGANASGTDGDIGTGKDVLVTSDANGVAVSSFIPGQRASSTEQVIVFACFGKTDQVESIAACPADRLRSVALTVVEQPLSITIGTDNLIGTGANGLTYTQKFTVLVVDAAGLPKPDVQLTPLLDLPTYAKGFYVYNSDLKQWLQNVAATCIAEDSSPIGFRNGTIERTSAGVSEDINGNGQLDPRKSDVSVAMVGSTKTDVNGTAVVRIEYPMSYGSWVEYSIRVTAAGVVSPPAWFGRIASPGYSLTSLTGVAMTTGVPFSVVKAEGAPPFVFSPYGTSSLCTSPN